MFFLKWRKKKRKRDVFHSITSLQRGHLPYPFHPVLRKPKTIIKEIKPTILHQAIKHDHFHQKTIVQMQPMPMFTQVHHLTSYSSWVANNKVLGAKQPAYLRMSMTPYTIGQILHHQLEEEKKYFQYHPAKARELAHTYIMNMKIQDALQRYILKDQIHVLFQHSQEYKQVLSMMTHKETPSTSSRMIQKQKVRCIHKQVRQKRETDVGKRNDIASTPAEVIKHTPVYIDKNALIQCVYQEVLRRLQREQLRKGRRS